MYSRIEQTDSPCPLCAGKAEESISLKLEVELATHLLAEQLDLLRDLVDASKAASKYLEWIESSKEDSAE